MFDRLRGRRNKRWRLLFHRQLGGREAGYRTSSTSPEDSEDVLLVFAVALAVTVLLSRLVRHTPLSAAALFLLIGLVVGNVGLGLLHPSTEAVSRGAKVALVAVLFTDGMKLGWRQLRGTWRLPGRALLLGLPLTVAVTAALAHLLTGLAWSVAFLLGAVLAPTDPVFAATLVGSHRVPQRLRRLLNVESGSTTDSRCRSCSCCSECRHRPSTPIPAGSCWSSRSESGSASSCPVCSSY